MLRKDAKQPEAILEEGAEQLAQLLIATWEFTSARRSPEARLKPAAPLASPRAKSEHLDMLGAI